MKPRNIILIFIITLSSISFLLASTEVVSSGPLISAGLGMLLIIISVFVMIYGHFKTHIG